jgi:hypothetical protein
MGLDNAWCSEATLVLETRSGSVWALTIGKYDASATCRNGSMAGKVWQAQLRGLDKSMIAQWDVATGRAVSVSDADLAQATESVCRRAVLRAYARGQLEDDGGRGRALDITAGRQGSSSSACARA